MRAYERLLNYVQFDTASNRLSPTQPSTPGQLVLAKALVEEMREMGIADARVDEYGYVYGSIPANAENQPAIGLVAHMDTIEDSPCMPMNPTVIHNYDGKDITLANGLVTAVADYPELKNHVGEDIIVTDGNTLLGADDKAGIAVMLTFAEWVLANPDYKHGKICLSFTPDEEIGRGTKCFRLEELGADYAYTLDGGLPGGIEFENFNAASAEIDIVGNNTHPGGAKDKMVNAALLAVEFASMLPATEIPACTSGFEGFYHLMRIEAKEESAHLVYIIRDHNKDIFESRKVFFAKCAEYMNRKYGEGTVTAKVEDQYANMRTVLEDKMYVVDRAREAYRAVGVEPYSVAIRGGTDGATLSYMGLPCPNIATGGMNAHGRRELAFVQDMDRMVEMLKHLIAAK